LNFASGSIDITGKTTSKRRTLGEEDFTVGNSAVVFALVAVAVFLLGLLLGFRQGRAGAREQVEQALASERKLAEVREKAQEEKYTQMKADLDKAFADLASKALRDNNDSFLTLAKNELGGQSNEAKMTLEAKELAIKNLLDPLKGQIDDFRKKVEEAQSDSKTGVTELRTLIGTLGNLNKALTEEAHNLATALRRDTKAQGNWGETILRNILDKSGLQEGNHYSFQQSFTESNGEGEPIQRRQTDVLVKLPGGRHLIIDSKVSLNAYNDSVNAENENDRVDALKRHLLSLRSHINDLAGRNYHTLAGIRSPEFVVMFVPIEPAFLLALQNDEALWHDAYSKGVLLSGPTTILFVIRIVADLWHQQRQADNVEKVMKRGTELYDKFVRFVSNLESIGSSLLDARNAYDEACKQLSTGPGNLVRQVEMLRQLGVAPKTKKQIPTKMLDAAELETDESTLALAAEAESEES
jgi:DNA recombination protein RmuC